MNREVSDLHAKVAMRTIASYLTRASNRLHERYVREASHFLLAGYSEQGTPSKKAKATLGDIVFTEKDTREVHWPHNDALVVQARIENVEVRRIMVGTGSSVNVMYRGCFDQMGLGLDQLMASPEPLYSFTGDAVTPTGCIRLPLRIGDLDHQATIMMDFLIINCPSVYNVVMGRPAMNDLNLVISTKALAIKFSTPNGIGCMRG
ncbi:uncharacterized protein LOC127794755 [Diospyros lotus]|uniref:uncharacterized protein LOC127794755 n=1 Tax=Diospyros lotus TaxID=55363 RepID=UPI002256645B|nr:uncharacterized protein LOC127794755 [Diospyros lotus]